MRRRAAKAKITVTRKDDRLELRISAVLMRRLNAWRERQDEVPTASAAARQLLEIALDAEGV
jgi:hypothetical protein